MARGRKPSPIKREAVHLSIATSILDEFNACLLDVLSLHVKYGARSTIVETLISRLLEAKRTKTTTIRVDDLINQLQ